jgi:hypothetical protein
MGDRLVLRIAGALSLLAVAAIVAAIVVRIGLGRNFGPEDFSQSVILQQLYLAGPAAVQAALLALIGLLLLLAAGLGWHQMLRVQGSHVTLGAILWYIGMVFLILQGAVEYSLTSFLPQAYVPAAELPLSTGLVAAGGAMSVIARTLSAIGDAVSFAGVLLLGAALWQMGGRWRILGAGGMGAALLGWLGLASGEMVPLRPVGQGVFLLWVAAMGVAMLRWKPAKG